MPEVDGDFELLEIIGRGSFGQIRKVRRLSDGQILVRKEISYKSMNNKERMQLLAETRILRSLVHPNVVQYIDHRHSNEDHMMFLYMEYCGGGDLAEVIRQCRSQNVRVPENTVWSIFCQLILALYRCHYNEDPPAARQLFSTSTEEIQPPPNPSIVILHRDIKPDNVFLEDGYSVKLGDFGLAKILDQDHFLANTYVGTPYYMSPEVLMDKPYTMQSDIWSLGCVIYELCALHPPFQAKSHLQLSQKIRDGVFNPLPDCYSSTLQKTIAACLNVNPVNRPTTATLLRLDVIKLCRRERDLINLETQLVKFRKNLEEKAQTLSHSEKELANKIDIYNEYINRDLQEIIEHEVEKRVKERLIAAAPSTATPDQLPANADITMITLSPETPLPSKLRGPRSLKNTSSPTMRLSPSVDQMTAKFQDTFNDGMRNNYDDNSSESDDDLPVHTAQSLTASLSSSGSSSVSYSTAPSASIMKTGPVDYENRHANIVVTDSEPRSGQTRHPLSSATNLNNGLGLGAAAAKARLMGLKSNNGAIGKTLMDLQRDKLGKERIWTEEVHGEEMPSPFLRKWEKAERMRNVS